MGNLLPCPVEDVAQLVPLAQDFCPFPDYNSSPLLFNMLSINSSVHLEDHYKAVQSSLTPTQLEDFTKRLRTTFGREGKVTHGNFGVVALSLAVLFDTLASKVKGECVSDQELIPRLFLQDLSGSYPPPFYTVIKLLRMVTRITNNLARMRQQTERYLRQLITEREAYEEQLTRQGYTDDFTALNLYRLYLFQTLGSRHLFILTNGTVNLEPAEIQAKVDITHNLNCDPEVASVAFMAEVQKSDQRTQEAFTACLPNTKYIDKPVLQEIVEIIRFYSFLIPVIKVRENISEMNKLIEDEFDLKAHALGKWA